MYLKKPAFDNGKLWKSLACEKKRDVMLSWYVMVIQVWVFKLYAGRPCYIGIKILMKY